MSDTALYDTECWTCGHPLYEGDDCIIVDNDGYAAVMVCSRGCAAVRVDAATIPMAA